MGIVKNPNAVIKHYKYSRKKDKFCQLSRNIIYKALENRLSIAKAIALANVSRSTFDRWIKRGEDPENKDYHIFRNRVEEIRAENEAESLEILRKVGSGNWEITETRVSISEEKGRTTTHIVKKASPNWQAAAWYLERCCTGYELKPYSDNNARSSEEIALEIAQTIREIEDTIPE